MVVILSGCLLVLLSFGIRSSFGLFLQPMTSDLGWGREIFAFAVALQNLLWGISQPIAGAIADRYGFGRVIAVGGLLYAAGVSLMAYSTDPIWFSFSAGVLIGLALSGTSFSVVLAAFARAVPAEKRSMALGVGTAAGSLGQFLLVPLGQAFLSTYGWSTALLLLGATSLIMIPLAVPLVTTTKPMKHDDQSLRDAIRQASGHSSYWYLTCGFYVCGFQVAFIAAHLPAYLSDFGLAPELGAWAIALVGLFNVIGSFSAGILGGRYSKKYLLSGIYVARSVVIALFVISPPTTVSTLIFAALIGILWLSTVPLTSGLVGQMFGVRYMATLFGAVFFSHQLGSFCGVWLGGALFDATGAYHTIWWISVALGLMSALLHWPIDERPVTRLVASTT